MSQTYWRPKTCRVVILSHFGEPDPVALARDLLSKALWDGAALTPGTRGDCRQIWLDNYTEPEADRLAAGKFPALGPGWKRSCVDNDPADWESFPGADERQRINNTIVLYQDELAALDAKENKDAADLARQADLVELIANLQTFGTLKAVPGTNTFGTDQNAIYRALNAPNFEFRYRSKFVLLRGAPFTLWLLRFKPVEGQINDYLQLGIGRGLRLLFEQDKATLFRRNMTRPEAEWQSQDARRNTLIQKRYGTRQQHEQITTWRDAIELINTDAKGRKKTEEEKAQIIELRRQIRDLQDTFKLTSAEKTELEELEKYLFSQTEAIDLDQTSDGLVGVPFSLTFFDFGFGIMQVVCDIGRNRWIYQDKAILKSQLWQWLWGTPANRRAADYDDGERLEISGNGGALLWRFGYVDVNASDVLLSAPLNLQRRDLDTEDGLAVNGQWTPNLPTGNEVAFLLSPAPGDIFGNSYQMGIGFLTDGRHYPIVTRASLQLPAGSVPARTVVWDSADHPEAIIKLRPKYNEKRGVLWDVTIHNKQGIELGLPDRLYERCCNIWVGDRPVMAGGIILEQTHDDLAGVTGHDEPAELQDWSEISFCVEDKLRIARHKRFPADFTFDGAFDNDIVRTALQAIGFNSTELSLIPAGEGERAPSAAPGEAPLLKPDKNVRVLDFLESEVVEKIGLGKQLFIDRDGYVRYEDPVDRLRTEIPYKNASEANANERIYFAGQGKTIQRIWNTEDYFTQFCVEGDTNPETKKPYSASYTIQEAVDPAFGPTGTNDPRFIGHHKPKETLKDETLNSQGAVERALATQIRLHGYPKPEWRVSALLDADVLPGDRLIFEDRAFMLVNVTDTDFDQDEMEFALEEVME